LDDAAGDGGATGGAAANQQLDAWLGRLRTEGMPTLGVMLGSAHQMGTCRMAASPKLGAAKPTGETWEVPGLFVADTSTFPTASGVNPMWTCAAIAHHVAQQVKQRLQTASPELREPASRRWRHRVACGCAGRASAHASAPEPVAEDNSTTCSDGGKSSSASSSSATFC